jgi:phosphatidylinositol alpha-1,6-mannosyltransferase
MGRLACGVCVALKAFMATEQRRLLLLTERFPPDLGGVARSAIRTAESFVQLGHEVHVLAWTKALPAGRLTTERIAVAPVSEKSGSLTVHRLGLYAGWDMSLQHTSNVLDWLTRQHAFDVIWGHYLFPAGFMAVLFGESSGLPSVVSARGNDVDRMMFPPGDFARLLWTVQRATAVTAVSEDLNRKLGVLLGRSRPVITLPNVVDVDLFAPTVSTDRLNELRTRLNIRRDEAILGFCGELRHKKGLPFLMQMLAEVNQVRPARLLVIGDVRAREQAALSLFDQEHPGLSQFITVTGHSEDRADVAARLQLCDIVLQPSVWDGMPNAVLEAMACGRIVIASDAGGLPEIIEHGKSGFMIDRSQLHRLGEAVLEVLSLPSEKRLQIEASARERMLHQFHPQLERTRLAQLLNQVLTPRGS